ncbi:MAG: hypothetical protein WC965_01690 [Thiohalomonadaceae bacterium]
MPTKKHKKIKELGIGADVIRDVVDNAMSLQKVAEKYDLSYTEVQRFIRDNKMNVYDDEQLEAIAMSEEFNPLGVVTHFFQSVHHASKELAFTGILAQMFREELAKKISEVGVEGIANSPSAAKLVKNWQDNANKLTKLVELSPKLLTAYIDLFSQVLDVQREVSYVKLITDLLRKEDPALYKKIQKALDADPTAKRVLDALAREDVLMYWDSDTGQVVRTRVELEDSLES